MISRGVQLGSVDPSTVDFEEDHTVPYVDGTVFSSGFSLNLFLQ